MVFYEETGNGSACTATFSAATYVMVPLLFDRCQAELVRQRDAIGAEEVPTKVR